MLQNVPTGPLRHGASATCSNALLTFCTLQRGKKNKKMENISIPKKTNKKHSQSKARRGRELLIRRKIRDPHTEHNTLTSEASY